MLKKIIYNPSEEKNNIYPFNLKWLNNFKELNLDKPITYIVGENGVGKSTLIQAIAIQAQIPQLTYESYENNVDYESILNLASCLKSQWTNKTKKGFYFRADDFISFVREMKKLRDNLETELSLLDMKGVNKLAFERQPFQNSLYELNRVYPKELSQLSHGQAFLSLFKSRLTQKGLYILDEPEIPLSPQNQLTLLRMIDDQTREGAQFIISTHSTILTAHPNADIYKVEESSFKKVKYDDIENVQFMKSFMKDPDRYMYYTLDRQ